MEFKLRKLTDPKLINEWLKLIPVADPENIKKVRKEIIQAVRCKARNLNYGIPFYFKLDGKIIAVSLLKQTEYDAFSSQGISIFHMAVAEKYQRQGIGKQMLFKLFKEAKKYRKKIVLLYTSNKSDFYKKCGMKEWGSIPKFTRKGRTRHFLYKKL